MNPTGKPIPTSQNLENNPIFTASTATYTENTPRIYPEFENQWPRFTADARILIRFYTIFPYR